MFIRPSFKKSLIVEQFQGNYLKMISHFLRVVHVMSIKIETANFWSIPFWASQSFYWFPDCPCIVFVVLKRIIIEFTLSWTKNSNGFVPWGAIISPISHVVWPPSNLQQAIPDMEQFKHCFRRPLRLSDLFHALFAPWTKGVKNRVKNLLPWINNVVNIIKQKSSVPGGLEEVIVKIASHRNVSYPDTWFATQFSHGRSSRECAFEPQKQANDQQVRCYD